MTIARVYPNGVPSIPTHPSTSEPYLRVVDFAAIDGHLQTAVDKTTSATNDPIAGKQTIGAGGRFVFDASATGSSSALTCSGAGKLLSATGAGSILLGDQDWYEYVAPRTFRRNYSPGEMIYDASPINFDDPFPWPTPEDVVHQWWFDPSTSFNFGTRPGSDSGGVPNSAMVVPLTRIWHGATLSNFECSFIVSGFRTKLPFRYPTFSLFRLDPFLGGVPTQIGSWATTTAANLTAYKNGHAAQQFSANYSEVIDAETYVYFLAFLDEDYQDDPAEALAAPNLIASLDATFTVADTRFQ